MLKYIKKLDFIATSIQFKFKGSIKNQTYFGGLLSFIALILILTDLTLNSIDLLTRASPSTYLSTQKSDFLTINFSQNIPMMFTVVGRFIELFHDQDKLFSMSGLGLNTILNKTTNTFQHELFNVTIEKCDREYVQKNFGKYAEYFLENLQENFSFCVPMNQSNYWINGIYGQTPFQFLDLYVDYCNNKTTNGSCYSMEYIKSTLNSFYILVSIPDFYFDHNNPDNPGVYYVVSRTYPLSASIYNRYFQVFKSVNYITDTGYVGTSNTKLQFFQQKALNIYSSIEYLSGTNQSMGGVTVGMDSDIYDVYYRSYKKFPTIIAELGGAFNVLFYAACIINYYFENTSKDIEIFDICCNGGSTSRIFSPTKTFRNNDVKQNTSNLSKYNNFFNEIQGPVVSQNKSKLKIEKKSENSETTKVDIKKDDGIFSKIEKIEDDYHTLLLKCILFEVPDLEKIIKTKIRFFDYFPCLRRNKDVIRKFEVIKNFSNQIFDVGFIFRNVLESHVFLTQKNKI